MRTMVTVSGVLLVLFIQTATARPDQTLREPQKNVTNNDRPNGNPPVSISSNDDRPSPGRISSDNDQRGFFGDIFKGIKGVAEDVVDVAGDVVDVVAGVGGDVVDVVAGVGGDVVDVVAGVGGDVVDVAGDVVDVVAGVGGDVVDVVAGVGGDVVDVVAGVGGDVVDVVAGVGGDVLDVAGDVVDVVAGVGGDVLDVAGDVVDVVAGVGGDVVDVVAGVAGDVVDVAGDVVDGVAGVAGDVVDVAGDVVDGVAGVAGDVVDGVAGVAGDVVDVVAGVGGDVLDVAGDVVDVVAGVAGDVVDVAGDVVDGVAGVAGDLVDGVAGVAGDVVDVAGDVVDVVTEVGGGAVGVVTEYIVDTLSDGLDVVAGEVDVEPSDSASTLAFVIDVTGSMSDDLEQVMEGTSRILGKTLSRRPSPVQNFVLVPFNDPDIGPVSITTDPEQFQHDLQEFSVYGGGDCPEMSMGAIKAALEVSLPRSFIYVFTDASAKDYHLTPDVLQLVQIRQSQVVFVLTGDCGNRTDPGYAAYEDIAATSSGQVFHLDSKDKVSKVLKWVEENLQAQKVQLLSTNHDGAQENTWEVFFDPSLREVTVSLSGPAPQIELTDPLGGIVGVEEGLTELLNIPNSVRVVNLKSPGAGTWTLKVSSSGRHTLRVTALSDLDFRVGFSSAPTSDFSSTRERPIEGVPAHVLLKVTGLRPPGQLSCVELLSTSGSSFSVLVPSDLGARGLWSLPGFHTPSQSFFIKVTGKDEEGHPFQRLSSVSYTDTVVTTTRSPSTISPTKAHPLEIAELVCGPRQILVGLRLASLVSYRLDAFSGHLDEHGCSNSTVRDGMVWYGVDRQADTCGNTLTTNSTHAIYYNTLYVYPASTHPLAILPMSFPFSCVYPLETETSLTVFFGRSRVQALTGLGRQARASMYLFHYSNYTMPYPAGPVILPHGGDVHVGLSVEWTDTDRFVLLLDNCYATPSYTHDDSTPHFLIQNKCPTNRREVRVDENGSSLQARFSAQLELFYLLPSVYLHCSLSLCDLTASSCSPGCSGRVARSVSSTVDIQPLTIGPITWEHVAD